MNQRFLSNHLVTFLLLLAFHEGCGEAVLAQSPLRQPGLAIVDTLSIAPGGILRLSHAFLVPGSILVSHGAHVYTEGSPGLQVDYRQGMITLPGKGISVPDSGRPGFCVVSYSSLALRFPNEYRIYEKAILPPDVAPGEIRVITPKTTSSLASYFGPDLQKSGYLGRGFTLGTNRDLSINSSFRLQLSGQLSKDITILAALTDENTPIQPEGNTRTLQELDKVFIKISGSFASATLGDYVLSYPNTEFGKYTRKLSGIYLEGTAGPASGSFGFASMKGIYHSMQFNGTDGVQGPYLLTGKNGEPRIVVLAGTERVFVDGMPMERGENADYMMEYGSGEITFRSRRLITSYTRITIDFEYADRQYLRGMTAADASVRMFTDRLTLMTRYLREADDPDAPIDLQLTNEDKRILNEAGDTVFKAARSGAVYVGRDSIRGIGAGQYVRVDTVLASGSTSLYRYEPGIDSATWSVAFSYVGQGQGDYVKKTFGTYTWVGPGAGAYAPVQLLPLPMLHQTLITAIRSNPVSSLQLQGEVAFSERDQNRLSTRDKENDNGLAWNMAAQWTALNVGFGTLDLSGRTRVVEAHFSPIDRVNDIEFQRRWDAVSMEPARESMQEATLTWRPWSLLALRGASGFLRQGEIRSQRLEGGVDLTPPDSARFLPSGGMTIERITRDDAGVAGSSDWWRSRGQAEMKIGLVTPKFRYETEYREARAGSQDTLLASSLAFTDFRPGLELRSSGPWSLTADFGWRTEDAVYHGALRRQATDILQTYGLGLRQWNDLSAQASVTVRDRTYTEEFRLLGMSDLQTILTRLQTQFTPWRRAVNVDALYEVSTERTARQERTFFAVPVGQGNYIYVGDLNGNGVQDISEFEPARFDGDYVMILVPSQDLIPTIDLRTNFRLGLNPSAILPSASSWLSDALRSISTETSIRIEEKSTDPILAHVYFLRTSGFLNDSTTIRGFQTFRQDVHLFEQRPEFSLRLRYDQSRGLTQFASSVERNERRERSVRIKSQLVREIGIQADLASTTDRLSSGDMSNRARDISAVSFSGDLSYRPFPRIEIGFLLSLKAAEDQQPGALLAADLNSQTLRTVISIEGPGRLRFEVERNEVVLSNPVATFPFELTDGRPDGQSWVWRVNFDYRLLSSVQATVSYLGRVEGARNAGHTMRAEVKAFF